MIAKNKNSYFKLPILDGLEILDAKNHTLNFPFHTHNTFNITLVLEQVFSTKTCDRLLQAPAGTIVITNPDEVHATICESKTGNSFLTFYVSPEVIYGLNKNKPVYFHNKIIEDPLLFQQLVHLSRDLFTLNTEKDNEFVKALRTLIAKHSSEAFEEKKISHHFRKFLDRELFEKFSLDSAAARFGVDKYKFLRLFKAETGLTPNNYIILKRIEKCKELLKSQNDLLGIAIETGFYDATHLCKHFKKITGISPFAYQKCL